MSDFQSGQRDSDAGFGSAVELMRACNHPVRLEILIALTAASSDVTTLAQALDLDIATVSYHLAPLRDAGLVHVQVDGKRHVYRLGPRAAARRTAATLQLHLEGESGGVVWLSVPMDLLPRTLRDLFHSGTVVIVPAARRKRRTSPGPPPEGPQAGPSDI